MRSCSEHPLRALWTAHRHLKEPSTPIRVASLVLASEALWYLEYFKDARIAAQAAVEADPESAQARWRLAVALYRRSLFSDSANASTTCSDWSVGSARHGRYAARSRSGSIRITVTQGGPTSPLQRS